MVWKLFRQKNQKRNQDGQAMIEFILGLMLVISFFFFYVKLAAVFAVGNYIHYATFMAARAYYSSSMSEPDQKANAEAVLSSMIAGRWKRLVKPKDSGASQVKGASVGPGRFFGENPYENSWNQGVTFHFESSVSLYPWDRVASPIVMDLTSESWLGREQSVEECKATKTKRIQPLLKDAVVYWENGNDGC